MTSNEIKIFQNVAWDSGWNCAVFCMATMLRSPILRADATREELADEIERMKVGEPIAPKEATK